MFRIFGPPGTGKTTTLLNMVDKALENGIRPMDIAFLAFTKKAATEAKERAAARFDLDPKEDLANFRTLHSLALAMSDIRKDQVMQSENYRELSKVTGVNLTGNKAADFEEDLPSVTSSSDPILGVINLARLRKVPLRDQYNISNLDKDWNLVSYVDSCLKEYKHRFGLYDFTDMLAVFANNGARYCPDFKLTFLDEAQDLSPLQWDIAHLLDAKSEKMYCAGDDDQAIYRWAGADVDHFITLEGGSETLSQSYRIPRVVHSLAEGIASRITMRFPKRYEPKKEEGKLVRINSVASLDMSEDSWLVMAQAGYLLQSVAQDLKAGGYLFSYRGHRSISERQSLAVNGWERLRNGKMVTGDVARKIYSFMSIKTRVTRGFKKLPGLDDDGEVNLEQLQEHFGLLATKDMIWHEAMDNLPETDRAYIIAMLRRGEKFNAEPRITVSTIHGSKGGEADNVVLFTDLSPAADEQMRRNPDDMHRVFYVAVTRTKNALYVVDAEDMSRSYDL